MLQQKISQYRQVLSYQQYQKSNMILELGIRHKDNFTINKYDPFTGNKGKTKQ